MLNNKPFSSVLIVSVHVIIIYKKRGVINMNQLLPKAGRSFFLCGWVQLPTKIRVDHRVERSGAEAWDIRSRCMPTKSR